MKVIIIDDEINCRELLQTMLEEFCHGIQLIGTAYDVPSGIALIKENLPDIILLDAELPGGDGIALLKAFPTPSFKIIVVSGYSFRKTEIWEGKVNGWIQKPVDLAELQTEILATGLFPPGHSFEKPLSKTEMTASQSQNQSRPRSEILLPTGNSYERILYANITHLQAHRSYAIIHLEDGSERLAAFPLRKFEQEFPENLFFRIHKSFLINGAYVKYYDRGRSGCITLENGLTLPIAARRKSDFVKFMKGLQQN